MSVKHSHISSSGSLSGSGGSIPGVTRVSSVRSSSSYRSPSVHSGHGGNVISTSSGYGGAGLGLGFGGGNAAGFTSSVSYGGGHSGGFGCGFGGGSGSFLGGDTLLPFSEKETMQELNDRLALYLGRVHSLEKNNDTLEKQIRDWYDKQVPYTSPDFHHYFNTIEDCQKKVQQSRMANANLMLQIDNAKLAADDFRNKCENERAIRVGVESDINGLRRVLEELNLGRNDCEMQLQTLNEEITYLKKNH
uniref:IF rod domain-containing protein n=1 Tax=Leptobrachium leishanense TaxID=445787 RepID=A0A8C5QWW9_9ANUR